MSDPYAVDSKTGLVKRVAPTAEAAVPVPEQRPPAVPPQFSKETLDGLSAMQAAMDAFDQPATPEIADVKPEEKLDLGETPAEVLARYNTMVYMNTVFDNKEARARIEDRCSELEFSDVILRGRVIQEVPINPGKITVVYQSLTATETLWLERESTRIINDFEARTWFGYAKLVASIISLNGRTFSPYMNDAGNVDSAEFDVKFKEVMACNDKVTEILLINLRWFEDRVAQLFVDDFDQLKNG